MLKLRLQRVGRIHEPSFRLVLTDSKNSTKSGRLKEILGSYDPRKSVDSFNAERIKYWLSQGAGLTATVNNLLIKHRIITGKKIDVSAKSKKAPVVLDVKVENTEVKEETVVEVPEVEVAPAENATELSPETTASDTIEETVTEEEKTV